MDYLTQHNIYPLIDVLGASVFYNRPDDPVQFLTEELTSLLRLKQGVQESSKAMQLFSDEDLEVLFTMFSKKMETITTEQAVTGINLFSIFLS